MTIEFLRSDVCRIGTELHVLGSDGGRETLAMITEKSRHGHALKPRACIHLHSSEKGIFFFGAQSAASAASRGWEAGI